MIAVGHRVLAKFTPPPRLQLSAWIEGNVGLPEGISASLGPMRLWPWQREIADAISDPLVERVTLLKASRIGFTALTVGATGAYVVNEPASILVLLPTESDCRDFIVSDVEPTFSASPAPRRALAPDREEGERDTLTSRRFADGSLKVVAAKAPRNLRRHTARILIVDEADACEVGAEGNPIKLGERRTLTLANRKIVSDPRPSSKALRRSSGPTARATVASSRCHVRAAARTPNSSGRTSFGCRTTPKTTERPNASSRPPSENGPYAQAYPTSDRRAQELPAGLHQYNWHRPHAGINSQTPISRLPHSEDNLLRLHI